MQDANLFLERRQFPRVQKAIPIRFRVIDDQKEIESLLDRKKRDQKAETIDLSEGGVYITAMDRLKIGCILRLDIQLAESPIPLSAFAEVVWSNETGAGLRFLAMKEEDAEKLKSYIEKTA